MEELDAPLDIEVIFSEDETRIDIMESTEDSSVVTLIDPVSDSEFDIIGIEEAYFVLIALAQAFPALGIDVTE